MKKQMDLSAAIFMALLAIVFTAFSSAPVSAEEGFWTFDNIPTKVIKEKYGFQIEKEWLDNIRLASTRFSDGGSGAFVTPTGLVLTNHHVAIEQLEKMSTDDIDYVKTGYYGDSPEKEIKCKDLELNVLVEMTDVTKRIRSSTDGLSPEDALKARKKTIAQIEKEKTGDEILAQVVTLYNGGEYWLYVYKKYRDIRLVMAPEERLANFGGDYDNFTYPRYSLDFAIFRVYENDRPVKAEHYLPLRPEKIKNGEPVFVSGHPAYSARFTTIHEIDFIRFYYKNEISLLKDMINLLEEYSTRGPQEKRRATAIIQNLNNSVKAMEGEFEGLKNREIYEKILKEQNSLKEAVTKDDELKEKIGDPWSKIEKTYGVFIKNLDRHLYRRMGVMSSSRLPGMAISMVFHSKEMEKPDGERIDGYHDSEIETWKYWILSPAPVYKDLEELILAREMEWCLEKLGAEDPFVKTMLKGKTPEERAEEVMDGTELDNPDYRKKLVEGGKEAILSSRDPLMVMAVELEPYRREMIEWRNKNIRSVLNAENEKIAEAGFAVYGKNAYPDATFTLRFAYGTVQGYAYNGTLAPFQTTFYGMFDRYESFNDPSGGWGLTEKILQSKPGMNLSTPLNFVLTCDTLGGNSGSPIFDKEGRVVGLLFDGNIESLVATYVFVDDTNRSVGVCTTGILEVLKNVYKTEKLVEELLSN